MKLAWPIRKETHKKQSDAETQTDRLKEELAKRRAELLKDVMELSKGRTNGG